MINGDQAYRIAFGMFTKRDIYWNLLESRHQHIAIEDAIQSQCQKSNIIDAQHLADKTKNKRH